MLLSVIVPVYNVENYLAECINSILCQTFVDFELILVNDGSTDSSLQICREFENKDSRVRVFDKQNGGQSSARNLGLTKASGKYISFIDSDDYISPDLFEAGITKLETNEYADFVVLPYERVGCTSDKHFTLVHKKGVESIPQLFKLWVNGKLLTNYMCDKIWRREVFNTVKFPIDLIFEDRYIFSDILVHCKRVYFANKGCYYYRMREGQTTGTASEFSLRSQIEADKHILDVIPHNLLDEQTIVKHRIFSTFIEYYTKYGYNNRVFGIIKKAIGSPIDLLLKYRPTYRMLIYSALGGDLLQIV